MALTPKNPPKNIEEIHIQWFTHTFSLSVMSLEYHLNILRSTPALVIHRFFSSDDSNEWFLIFVQLSKNVGYVRKRQQKQRGGGETCRKCRVHVFLAEYHHTLRSLFGLVGIFLSSPTVPSEIKPASSPSCFHWVFHPHSDYFYPDFCCSSSLVCGVHTHTYTYARGCSRLVCFEHYVSCGTCCELAEELA